MKYLLVFVIAALIIFPCEGFTQSIDAVFAVGDNSTLLRLISETSWAAVPVDSIPGCGDLLSVWGSSDHDVYVTGCYDELLHFDGTQWQKIPMPNSSVRLSAVSGTGFDNIYAGGYIPGPDPNGLSYHFDGLDWNEITGGGNIQRIWADPGGGFYAISEFYDSIDRYWYQWVVSYKNGGWNSENLMIGSNPYYHEDEYYRIAGHGTDRPVVTGYWEIDLFDFIDPYDEYSSYYLGTGGAIHVKENSTWDVIRENVACGQYPECPLWSTVWHGVCCVSEYEIWLAGENKVMRWTPWGSTVYDLPLPTAFRAVWAISGSNVYVACDYGIILHFNGSIWRSMETPTTENLHDIWGCQGEVVATLLQSFSTSAEGSIVTIHWSLSELEEDTRFRIKRTALHEHSSLFIDDNPALERDGLSFTYVDHDVDPGGAYEYTVEYSSEEGWRTLFESGIVSIPDLSFTLFPNYPNPFNPSTTITYSVPSHGLVTLRIFDISGKLVKTILNEEQGQGRYTVHWDGLNDRGRRVVSGTYFCRLTAGKETVSRKLILMR